MLRKVVREKFVELLEIMREFISFVDEEEQKELEEMLGKPKDYSEGDFMD